FMARRGSTVGVRQRALQKRRTSAPLCSGPLAERALCGGYGAVYGAPVEKPGDPLARPEGVSLGADAELAAKHRLERRRLCTTSSACSRRDARSNWPGRSRSRSKTGETPD